MKSKTLRELTDIMSEELEAQEQSYFSTINDGIGIAEWTFEDIRRAVLVEPAATHKALMGIHLSKRFPSGALGELTEEANYVDTRNFEDNFTQAYKQANEYGEEDLEINQASRF